MKIIGIINILKIFYIFIKDNRNSTLILYYYYYVKELNIKNLEKVNMKEYKRI